MAELVQFYMDENVPSAIAKGLRIRGLDVLTTLEVGRDGDSDDEQLAFAEREGRVMVTHDEDFLILHAEGARHAGIVYAKEGTRSVGEMIRFLILLFEVCTATEMRGRVEFA